MAKKVEKEITVDASPDVVWKAISEGEELKRWFPLDARVNPGAGGSVWLSWGEGSDWESPIEIWEPGRHLRTVDTMPAAGDAPPVRIAVDYIIEAGEGSTTLRIVQSGFGDDAWDDELDTLNSGWAAFLATLAHYLRFHRGEPRQLAFFRHPPVPLHREEVFRRTMAALGLDPARMAAGEKYATTTRGGDRFEGVARVFAPPVNFSGTVENWNDGFLMVEIEPGRERCRPAIWFSLYGAATDRAPSVQQRLRDLLESEFASASREERADAAAVISGRIDTPPGGK